MVSSCIESLCLSPVAIIALFAEEETMLQRLSRKRTESERMELDLNPDLCKAPAFSLGTAAGHRYRAVGGVVTA